MVDDGLGAVCDPTGGATGIGAGESSSQQVTRSRSQQAWPMGGQCGGAGDAANNPPVPRSSSASAITMNASRRRRIESAMCRSHADRDASG
jgi:hypothetical protein